MSDPTRLLEDPSATEEVAALLRSMPAPEAPSPAKQAELARKLATMAGPVPVATVITALRLKAGLVLGVLGLAGIWTAIALHQPGPDLARRPTSSVPAASTVPTADDRLPPTEAVAPIAAASAEPPKDRPLGSSRPKPAVRDSLADEEALLEQARRVASSSPSQALGLLQQHERRFPNGQLTAERLFLSVDVLTRLGQTATAHKQAERLIRAFPGSVYAAQLKASRPER